MIVIYSLIMFFISNFYILNSQYNMNAPILFLIILFIKVITVSLWIAHVVIMALVHGA